MTTLIGQKRPSESRMVNYSGSQIKLNWWSENRGLFDQKFKIVRIAELCAYAKKHMK